MSDGKLFALLTEVAYIGNIACAVYWLALYVPLNLGNSKLVSEGLVGGLAALLSLWSLSHVKKRMN
jgi:hypothetical protein